MTSLYERLGGQAAISATVDLMYQKILADNRISHFFRGVNMDHLRAKQKAFLAMAFGGPSNYTGKDLREGHKYLVVRGLTDKHFDAVGEHIQAALKELGVAEPLIAEVLAIAESVRDQVLNKKPATAAIL